MSRSEVNVMNDVERTTGDSQETTAVGGLIAYQGKNGCQSPICRSMPDGKGGWKCVGWHCAVCHRPSSYQGHPSCAKDAGLL